MMAQHRQPSEGGTTVKGITPPKPMLHFAEDYLNAWAKRILAMRLFKYRTLDIFGSIFL